MTDPADVLVDVGPPVADPAGVLRPPPPPVGLLTPAGPVDPSNVEASP